MTIASSSKGNCTCIRNDNCIILIDMGVSLAHLKRGLCHYKIAVDEIDAVIITHEHYDHILGIKSLVSNYDIPIYAHCNTMKEIKSRLKIDNFRAYDIIESGFSIKDMDIQPFRTRHDAVYSLGYSVKDNSGKISIATDLGIVTKGVYNNLVGSDIVLIESNHDENMLKNGNYPMCVKNRILSNTGHLSNKDCANAVLDLYNMGTSRFILGHLSENNNTKRLAYASTSSRLLSEGIRVGQDIMIDVAGSNSLYAEYSVEGYREIKQII